MPCDVCRINSLLLSPAGSCLQPLQILFLCPEPAPGASTWLCPNLPSQHRHSLNFLVSFCVSCAELRFSSIPRAHPRAAGLNLGRAAGLNLGRAAVKLQLCKAGFSSGADWKHIWALGAELCQHSSGYFWPQNYNYFSKSVNSKPPELLTVKVCAHTTKTSSITIVKVPGDP